MSTNTPIHNLKELIHLIPMNTVACKKAIATHCGVKLRTIDKYYQKSDVNIRNDIAFKILEFLNENRISGTREFTMADLFPVRKTVHKDEITEALNFVK